MTASWGDQIDVEQVAGVPFRMYSDRPRRLTEVLALAVRWGARPFVIQGQRALSFEAFLATAVRKASELASLGVTESERVLILGWNGPDWIINFWACQIVGAVPALANAWWSEVEVRDAIELLDPWLVLSDKHGSAKLPACARRGVWGAGGDLDLGPDSRGQSGQLLGIVDPPLRTASDDEAAPAVIIFTSGSSGKPKAVELSHRALLANLQMLLNLTHRLPQEVKDDSGEVTLHTGPLFHVGGAQMLLRAAAVGNTVVMPVGRFDPAEIVDLIERYGITRWAAVPTMITRLLDQPGLETRDIKSLKALTIGGASVHAELLARIREQLPGVQAGVPTGYGLTENCGQATAASGRDTLRHPGSAGKPLPCVELKFLPHPGVHDPEVLLRSPTQMTRYVGVDETPIDDEGWLHTGDLGQLDEDGRLWITGRAKDLIIRGGENIAPAAVERALTSVPGVAEAAVIGIPHPDLGEEVCAFVVVTGGGTGKSLAEQLKARLASFAVPTVWHIGHEPLPTNQTGKVDKRALEAIAREPAPTGQPQAGTVAADFGRD